MNFNQFRNMLPGEIAANMLLMIVNRVGRGDPTGVLIKDPVMFAVEETCVFLVGMRTCLEF